MEKGRYSPDDLNEKVPGLGDEIRSLLNQIYDYVSFVEVKRKVDALLTFHDFSMAEVVIDDGFAKGLTIETAFKNAEQGYQP